VPIADPESDPFERSSLLPSDRGTFPPVDRGSSPGIDEGERISHGPATPNGLGGDGDLRAKLQRYEAQLILDALRANRWNQTEAAKQLGMPLRTLVHKIKVFEIKKLDR
jgi:DNA-binding NtrC family response regulator